MASGVAVDDLCPQCRSEFGLLRWRHLCRLCQINFCDDCTPHRYDVGRPGGELQRVCGPCLVGAASVKRDTKKLLTLPVSLLKQVGAQKGVDFTACFDKSDVVDRLVHNLYLQAHGQYHAAPSSQQRQQQSSSSSASSSSSSSSSRSNNQHSSSNETLNTNQSRATSSSSNATPPTQTQQSQSQSHSQSRQQSQPPANFPQPQTTQENQSPSQPAATSSSSPSSFQQAPPSNAHYESYDAPDVDLSSMNAKKIREFLDRYGIDSRDCFDKESLVEAAQRVLTEPSLYLISEEETCIICMDARASTEFRECGHRNSCKACARLLVQKTNSCPTCRSKITRIVDYYHNG